jgi:hypothetical protein
MKPVAKALLMIETTVCFAPAGALLCVGLLMVPTQIYFLITGPGEASLTGPLTVIALTAGGAAGVVALLNLLFWIVDRPSAFIGRYWTLAGAIAGGAALLPYTAGEVDSPWWRLVGWMPLVCSIHLIYLGRDFLFPGK